MGDVETITVPHLGSSTIGYRLGKAYDATLPTLVMVNSFSTSVELYRPQFADEKLMATANLLANVRAHTPPGAPARVSVSSDGELAAIEVAHLGPIDRATQDAAGLAKDVDLIVR